MKKFFAILLVSVGALLPAVGQVQSGSLTALAPVFIPATKTIAATCTSTCPVVTFSGMSAGTVRITGTHSAMALAIQGSNDGVNYTTLPVNPVGGGAAITSITANGFFYVNLAGLSSVKYSLTTLTGTSAIVKLTASSVPGAVTLLNPNSSANPTAVTDQTGANFLAVDASGIASVKHTDGTNVQPTGDAAARVIFVRPSDGTNSATIKAASTTSVATDTALVSAQSPNAADPCANYNNAKSVATIAFSSATTTKVVDVSGSMAVYVCGFVITYTSGTAPTIQFKAGTNVSTDCDTGASNLTAVMALPATAGLGFFVPAGGSTQFATPATKQLCIVAGGTSPTFNGYLTYVQK